jgi:uncharacterized protein YbjQ (UPF0145 family)
MGFTALLTTELGADTSHCRKCSEEVAAQSRAAERQRLEHLTALSKKIVVTTTPNIDGYRVRKYLGIESVEFVIGTGIFSEVSGSIADFFGARSSAFETKLRAAKQYAMDALKFLAAEKGANAVVAVDLDYAEFSGNRIALIINGTLVAVEPIEK